MIRRHLIECLTRELGSASDHEPPDWWIDAGYNTPALHVCLDRRVGDNDHPTVMVFDPTGISGEQLVELKVKRMEDCDDACRRVMHIVQLVKQRAPERPPQLRDMPESSPKPPSRRTLQRPTDRGHPSSN